MVNKNKIIMDPREALLREEILFWQKLLEEWEHSTHEPAPDRMRDALALAMYRLELYLADEVFFEADIPPHHPHPKYH